MRRNVYDIAGAFTLQQVFGPADPNMVSWVGRTADQCTIWSTDGPDVQPMDQITSHTTGQHAILLAHAIATGHVLPTVISHATANCCGTCPGSTGDLLRDGSGTGPAMRVTEHSLSDEAIRAKLRDHKKCSSSTAREAGAVPAPACQPH